jgi:fused signal recognition particle receptor
VEILIILLAVLALVALVGVIYVGSIRSKRTSIKNDVGIKTDKSVKEEITSTSDENLLLQAIQPFCLRERLDKTRSVFTGALGAAIGRGVLRGDSYDEIEELLIRSDVGIQTTLKIIDELKVAVKEKKPSSVDETLELLKKILVAELLSGPLNFSPVAPSIWLFVGVNGVGKTSTIGKLAYRYTSVGKKVLLAGADTFRAAAGEQLEIWANRCGADIVLGSSGADPSSVVFDAVSKAKAKGYDLVMADTAGRLHNKKNLMQELSKIYRVASKNGTVTEVILVLDATTGQNGLVQAEEFLQAAEVTGLAITKLDGTAKGGIAISISSKLHLPIKLVGTGERPEDLIDFNPEEFIEAIIS